MTGKKIFNDNFQFLDNNLIIVLIELYLSKYLAEFIAIRSCIDRKDFLNLTDVAYKQRSYGGYFGDPLVREQSGRLENITKNNNIIEDGLENLLDELDTSN